MHFFDTRLIASLLLATCMLPCISCSGAAEIAEDEQSQPAAAAAQVPAAASVEAKDRGSLWTRKVGQDWPKFLGPTGDSKSSEQGIITKWPASGPKILWSTKLGEGYGMCTVAAGRLYQFDRFGDEASVYCLEAETGKPIWKYSYITDYLDLYGYNNGPRCSPIVDGDRVYAFGVDGMLLCLDAIDGTLKWKLNTNEKFGVVQNFFGVGSCPVIHGNLLIAMIGGSPEDSKLAAPGQLDRVVGNGSGIVAFDKLTGEVKYKITDELASYASLQLAKIDGRDWCFAFCRSGLVGFEPTQGKVDFEFPWRATILESVNASSPVVVGNQVLISECYGPGSAMLSVKPGGFEVAWQDNARTRQKSLQTHWNTPVVHEGFAYACSGRHSENAELRCIDWKTGKVQWSERGLDRSSLLYVDGHFVYLGEYGDLKLIKANPAKFDVVSECRLEVQLDPQDTASTRPLLNYPCWAAPILSHGLLYVRGDDQLICLELIPEAAAK